MKLLSRLNPFAQKSADPAVIQRLDQLAGFFGTDKSAAGKAVNHHTALGVMTVLACVRVLSEGVASLPVMIKRRDGAHSVAVPDHAVWSLLNRRPNEWQTGFEFRETMMIHAALTGNAFAFKVRAGGKVAELIPLMPHQVSVYQEMDHAPTYIVSDHKGQIIGRYTRADIMHVRGPSWNGYLGWDTVRQARDAIGLGMATEEAQAKLFANGGRPGGLLSTDAKMGEEQMTAIRKAWQAAFSGANQFRTAVLDMGLKYTPLAMTGVDSQHLETRKFQIEEICRAFNVFPQMVMHSDKTSTYASAEAFFTAHLRHTLSPWLERLEQVYDLDLLDGTGPLEAKHDTRQLEKANAADRQRFYASMAQIGIYTRNEIRELEGLPPLDGLSEPLTPLNLRDGPEGVENP